MTEEDRMVSGLRLAFELLAETKLSWIAEGRSERAYWKWVRDIINRMADLIESEDAMTDAANDED